MNWSSARIALVSFVAAASVFLGVYWFRQHGLEDALPKPEFGFLADLLQVVATLVAIVPIVIALYLQMWNRVRPLPGRRSYGQAERDGLRRAFEVDRNVLADATVPTHLAQAKPARSARSLDFGDASLVLHGSERDAILQFIGCPRRSRRATTRPARFADVLVITGEPGAGKSVLLQELHASLSLGVELGSHGLVPLLVLARDLTLESARHASQETEVSLRRFLTEYYERRIKDSITDQGLMPLLGLVRHGWRDADVLVIVDGLDEIPQRSAYEEIQRQLSDMIEQDIRANHRATHRYILSCRIDEDLELFPGAQTIELRGLSDEQREGYCAAIMGRRFDKTEQRLVMQSLRSERFTPSHLFRRNPYFLALLIQYIAEGHDRVRARTLDFGYLMRRYLEREAVRPHARSAEAEVTVQERRVLFEELEGIASFTLQLLAFQSSVATSGEALYHQTSVDSGVALAFSTLLGHAGGASHETSAWRDLAEFLGWCHGEREAATIDAAAFRNFGVTRSLRENELRLFGDLSTDLRRLGNMTPTLVLSALGTMPHASGIEDDRWYQLAASVFAAMMGSGAHTQVQQLHALVFFRGLLAAHVLRIVTVTLDAPHISVRFRHRRLAEYYAACYLRARWTAMEQGLTFSPWLAPVLNLACALEGPECRTLNWILAEAEEIRGDARYEWRFAVEAGVEACFFARPGQEYDRAVRLLALSLLEVLQTEGGRRVGDSAATRRANIERLEGAADLDAVTRMTVLRALERLGRAGTVLTSPVLGADHLQHFSAYEDGLPGEWLATGEAARTGVERLSGRRTILLRRLWILWRLCMNPDTVFTQAGRLEPWTAARLVVAGVTAVGELSIGIIFCAAVGLTVYVLARWLQVDSWTKLHATWALGSIVVVTYTLLRIVKWHRSRTNALRQAAALWRIPGAVRNLATGARGTLADLFALPIRRIVAISALALSGFGFASVIAGVLLIGVYALLPSSLVALTTQKPPILREDAKSGGKPCPEITEGRQRILDRYRMTPGDVSDADLLRLRTQLRKDVEGLQVQNRLRRCGRTIEGEWILAEESVADLLAEHDPRMVPIRLASGVGQVAAKDLSRIRELTGDAPGASSTFGVLASLAAIHAYTQESKVVEELLRLRSKVVKARRAGVGVPVASVDTRSAGEAEASVEIRRSNEVIRDLDATIKLRRQHLEPLEGVARQGIVVGVMLAIGVGMSTLVLVAAWRRRHDRKHLNRVRKMGSSGALLKVLLDATHSERVRVETLRCIERLGADADSLRRIEEAAGVLLDRPGSTERMLGIATADLTRALGNRLRHRAASARSQAPSVGVGSP